MSAYVAGDARAFEALFERWAPRLHAFFSRAFRSGAVADDLLQTTFLKVHAARARYDQSLPLRPWVFGIAARVRADELRRRYRSAKNLGSKNGSDDELERLQVPVEGGADAWPEITEAREKVREAVDALPEGQRIVVLLHRFDGLTFGEIAEVVSEAEGKPISEGAVRVRAFRAYEVLRKELTELSEVGAERAAREEGTP